MVFLLVGARNTMAALLNSLEDGGEDDERKIEKDSTAGERYKRWCFQWFS
jgi:hypothetical protein